MWKDEGWRSTWWQEIVREWTWSRKFIYRRCVVWSVINDRYIKHVTEVVYDESSRTLCCIHWFEVGGGNFLYLTVYEWVFELQYLKTSLQTFMPVTSYFLRFLHYRYYFSWSFSVFLLRLYINDIVQGVVGCNIRRYAGDMLEYKEVEMQNCVKTSQLDLRSLEKWISKWKMNFNPKKSQTVPDLQDNV